MTLYETKKELFHNYCKELQGIAGLRIRTREENNEQCNAYINDPEYKWINIFDDDKELIGFLIFSRTMTHPKTDCYIAEAYVIPEKRHHHFMTKTAADYLSRHPGRYCLHVLRNNDKAKTFWLNFFEKMKYRKLDITDVSAYEFEDFFAWESD